MVVINSALDSLVQERFPRFGVNKRREVARLLFEVARKEGVDTLVVAQSLPQEACSFAVVKDHLLARRYPDVPKAQRRARSVLPALDTRADQVVDTQAAMMMHPQTIYVEERVQATPLAARVRHLFPQAHWQPITTVKDYQIAHRQENKNYNQRLATFFLVKEEYEFFLRCPCSSKSVACGYHVMSMGHGCAFECAYCYLQAYVNAPGIRLPANIEDFFDAFKAYKQDVRLGTGQFTDSLVFDHITGYSPQIIDFFRQYPLSTFEFKTKSDNIDLILKTKPAPNIVVAWSLNPSEVIETVEFYTASLERRLQAAQRCVQAGYKVAFHFDPIIYYEQWARDYQALVERLFDQIDARQIAWISLGGLRMTSSLKKTIEARFPENTMLNATLLPGYDQKLRYSRTLRTEIFTQMRQWISQRAPKVYLYLCMEDKLTCGACQSAPLKPYATHRPGR